MSKILIVEDEESIAELEKDYLELSGFEVEIENDGSSGLDKALKEDYDLLILDLMLPGTDGFEICKRVREVKNTPIIMVSAKKEDIDKIRGLGLGADDYITKPFSMPLVLRRIEAVLRRSEQGMQSETAVIHYKDITMDTDSFTVHIGQELVPLTTREFEILKFLLENQGRVFTRDHLLNSIWGYDFFGDEKIVNTHIKNIRKKLGAEYIETIRGVGYKIAKEDP